MISLALTLWKPLSPFLSGLLVGLIFAAGIAYIVIRLYINAKLDEKLTYQWLDFTDLETMFQDKAVKPDKQTTLYVKSIIQWTIRSFLFILFFSFRRTVKSFLAVTMLTMMKNSFDIQSLFV